jgi:hypothetical protein
MIEEAEHETDEQDASPPFPSRNEQREEEEVNDAKKRIPAVDKLDWDPSTTQFVVSQGTMTCNAQTIIRESLFKTSQGSRARALTTAREMVRILEGGGGKQEEMITVPKKHHEMNESIRKSIGSFLNHPIMHTSKKGRRSDTKQRVQNAVLSSFVTSPDAEDHVSAGKLATHIGYKNARSIKRGIDIRHKMDTTPVDADADGNTSLGAGAMDAISNYKK